MFEIIAASATTIKGILITIMAVLVQTIAFPYKRTVVSVVSIIASAIAVHVFMRPVLLENGFTDSMANFICMICAIIAADLFRFVALFGNYLTTNSENIFSVIYCYLERWLGNKKP